MHVFYTLISKFKKWIFVVVLVVIVQYAYHKAKPSSAEARKSVQQSGILDFSAGRSLSCWGRCSSGGPALSVRQPEGLWFSSGLSSASSLSPHPSGSPERQKHSSLAAIATRTLFFYAPSKPTAPLETQKQFLSNQKKWPTHT